MEYLDAPTEGDSKPAATSSEAARTWVSPGVSVRKRWLTGIGVLIAAAVFFWIALSEGASMLVSTAIGAVFIGCFIWYLKSVAPTPFTIRLDERGVSRIEQDGEAQTAAWGGIAKIKEEVFKNGTSVSLTLYKRVGERGLHRSWVAYRDDLPDFDVLADALRAGLPDGTPWIRERVHE
jgi:hypothetical protein